MIFGNPDTHIGELGLAPGQVVADFGCGTGSFSLAAAKAVSPSGKIYSVDVQKDHLAILRDKANELGVKNIETVWADIDKLGGSTLADKSCDVVILGNVLFQLENKDAAISEIARVLRPGGRVLVIDWSETPAGGLHGSMLIREDDCAKLFTQKGFIEDRRFSAGNFHYGLILRLKN